MASGAQQEPKRRIDDNVQAESFWLVQAGAVSITAVQYLFELYRDWSRQDEYNDVIAISKQHGGVFGVGIGYAFNMFAAQKAQPEPEEAAPATI